MKRYKCPICGNPIEIESTPCRCKSCQTLLDEDLVFNKDSIKKKKFDYYTYAANLEFKKIVDLDYDSTELIFDYYKMYANLNLNRNYKPTFFENEHKYTVDELDHVILHMLEHNKYYDYKDMTSFIDKYAKDNEKYKLILSCILRRMDERIIEKDLRSELFKDTRLPFKQKLYNSRKEDGKSIFLVGLLLMIVFPAIVFIFFKGNLRYYMFNIALIVPILFLTSGICKFSLKKNNFLIFILIFILLYYLLTLLYGFSYMNIETNIFFDHLKGIGLTPYELIKALIESTGK